MKDSDFKIPFAKKKNPQKNTISSQKIVQILRNPKKSLKFFKTLKNPWFQGSISVVGICG